MLKHSLQGPHNNLTLLQVHFLFNKLGVSPAPFYVHLLLLVWIWHVPQLLYPKAVPRWEPLIIKVCYEQNYYLLGVDASEHEVRIAPSLKVNQFSIELKHFNILIIISTSSRIEQNGSLTLWRLHTLCMITAASRILRFSFFGLSWLPLILPRPPPFLPNTRTVLFLLCNAAFFHQHWMVWAA